MDAMREELEEVRRQLDAVTRRADAAEAALRAVAPASSNDCPIEDLDAMQRRFRRLAIESPSKAEQSTRMLRPALSVLLNEQPLHLSVHLPPEVLRKAFQATEGVANGEVTESKFYPLATWSVPSCVEAHTRTPRARQNGEALYGSLEQFEVPPHVSVPLLCEPEIFVRVLAAGDPAFTGEMKRWPGGALNEVLTYALLALLHSAFRVEPGDVRGRRFHVDPPVCYALLSSGPCGYLVGVEWVGKLLAYVVSQPFFLGSPQHAAAVAALPLTRVRVESRVVVPAKGGAWRCHPAVGEALVMWTVEASAPAQRFYKIIRCTAFDGLPQGGVAYLRALHAVHTAYATARADATADDPPPAALLEARLLYGVFELLVEMPFVGDRDATAEELGDRGGAVLRAVATALVWLARRRLLYVDLRPANVRVAGGAPPREAWLVDYDDMHLMERPARSADDLLAALRADTHGANALDTTPELSAALRDAWPAAPPHC